MQDHFEQGCNYFIYPGFFKLHGDVDSAFLVLSMWNNLTAT